MDWKERFPVRILLALVLLLSAAAADAQFWSAEKMLADVKAPVIVAKDKNGKEVRIRREWVERSMNVLERMAPAYGFQKPPLFVSASPAPNAFVTLAKNGPVMVIHTGMLRTIGDDADLTAALIGHELGHLKAQHLTKGASNAAGVAILGALLGAAVDANQAKHGRDTHGLGTALGAVGAHLVNAKFSRDQEREADSLGIEAMARAGFDPSAAARLWRRMSNLGGGDGLWLDSHPSHAEREQAMTQLASSLQPVYAANKPAPSSLPSYADPYPRPQYTNFDPSSEEVAAASSYHRGRVAYQERRFEDARQELQEAASSGDERALTLLGGMALSGQGQPADLPAAREYFEKAASKGFSPAIERLGYMSLRGLAGPKDASEALRLFVFADARGYAPATAALGMMYIEGSAPSRDASLSRRLAEKAADAGDPLGKALLGALLRDGLGGSAEPERGFALLSETAQKLGWASYQLGIAYERGVGTPADREKAIEAYRRAAARGISAAETRLKRLVP